MKEKYRSGKYGSIPELIWYATPGKKGRENGALNSLSRFCEKGNFLGGRKEGRVLR